MHGRAASRVMQELYGAPAFSFAGQLAAFSDDNACRQVNAFAAHSLGKNRSNIGGIGDEVIEFADLAFHHASRAATQLPIHSQIISPDRTEQFAQLVERESESNTKLNEREPVDDS
jgi:8-oxo-dGTP pyrophosphatase MutT (NUDIX family)